MIIYFRAVLARAVYSSGRLEMVDVTVIIVTVMVTPTVFIHSVSVRPRRMAISPGTPRRVPPHWPVLIVAVLARNGKW